MFHRRKFLAISASVTALVVSGCDFSGAPNPVQKDVAGADDTLRFDPAKYTELTKNIMVGDVTYAVKYRFYKAIPYVAKPVDVTYQCLNISVPTEIDGKAIDASKAPILFANNVGGYMPSSVAEAQGIASSAGMMGPPPGMGGGLPNKGEVASGSSAMVAQGKRISNAEIALASGYVVVEPGARGRTLQNAAGDYYGVAPAAIVDLKAAVRYLKYNKGKVPGNTDWIISSGTSAGGALSSLLGASGDNILYADDLAALGAAASSDAIFAAGCWCPITDLDHADMAYEWNWGNNPLSDGKQVDRILSAELAAGFLDYQAKLDLNGPGDFGPLTAEKYPSYLMDGWLLAEATHHLANLGEKERIDYLAANPDIRWENGKAVFTWAAFLAHVGARKKNVPAFDALDLSTGENNLFGLGKVKARHFTPFSAAKAAKSSATEGRTATEGAGALAPDIPRKTEMMNPMGFIASASPGRARNWWLRVGAKDSDTSLTVVGNLHAALMKNGDKVNTRYYWDAGHGANEDAPAFMAWIAEITGYGKKG